MKEMKLKMKLTISSRKCLEFKEREEKKNLSNSEEEGETVKTSSLKLSNDSLADKLSEDPESFEDKYKLVKKLGEGSNGVVHKCIHLSSGKVYAVKISRCDIEHMINIRKSYLFTKKLRHPNIVRYKALYMNSEKRRANIIMELF